MSNNINKEHISIRAIRLNNIILGNSQATSKTNKYVSDALSREGLLDALFVLYNECNKDFLKKRDKNIQEFATKYRPIMQETSSIRISKDDFKIKAQIGKGYFGNVYLVEEKTTSDIYAMKKIKKSGVINSQVKEERDIMAKRESEWITSLQYAFQDVDHLYLVMEYLPGGDLLSLMIRNGPFDEELAKFYLAELTLAINALHQMGYVHRDIKPENILIDRFGHIKLGDFGNSVALDKDGHVTSLSPVGTPDYIAPELLQSISSTRISKSVHDEKCDFWSMGVIGYELIFETTPFHEDNVHETYSKILSHCDNSNPEVISYPTDVKISPTFKNLIEGLIIKPSIRLTYGQIIKHPFFEDINWNDLRQVVPPIIPTVNGNDDISNFEDIERTKARRSTFIKKSLPINSLKSNEFTGKDLPFIGYGFIHEEILNDYNKKYDENFIAKLNNKIKEISKINKNHNDEIKTLQEKLLKAERNSLQSDSLNRVLKDSKEELNRIKDKLKEKTIELASCRTEIRTLKSSLKIEEESRVKNEATIHKILNSTYQKWEKSKMISDQNYEKQIAEKKTEISNITQKLLARENELSAKIDECSHLQKKIENYKEMLKSIKDRNNMDKTEYEKVKQQLMNTYEMKIIELTTKLKAEKEMNLKLNTELREIKHELDESVCTTNSSKQAKLTTEKNMENMKERLNKEIDLNNELRSQNAVLQKQLTDNDKKCEQYKKEVEKLKEEMQLIECSKIIQQFDERASPYQTAHGSLTELVEEQLRNDLQLAKEQEDVQRKRADRLEEVVAKLETLITKLKDQPQTVGDLLEKQNEKLEDKLLAAREQAVVERQSARTANLSLWKLEKQVEDISFEKKTLQKKLESTEEKIKKLQSEKANLQQQLKENQSTVKQRESKIFELKDEIMNLKSDLQKEHKMWEKSEQERMKEKSENIENVSKIHQMQEKLEELKMKFAQITQRNDGLNIENRRLMREINEERKCTALLTDQLNDIHMKLKSSQQNYDVLKMVCSVTDTQLSEMEVMLETEQNRNKANDEKIEKLWKDIRNKDEQIAKLKQTVDTEKLKRSCTESEIKEIQNENNTLRKNFDECKKKITDQQTELATTTTSLIEHQEQIELLKSELENLKTMNSNYEKQIISLKEESSRILSDLFMAKEEINNLSRELKSSSLLITDLKQEIDQLNGTLTEQKNYYLQREIKSEATLTQHKKLIDYLQIKVEDLSQKKKKTTLMNIFSSSTTASKKENISNVIESSIMYRTLQEELKREKQENKQLKEELTKYKNDINLKKKDTTRQQQISVDPSDEATIINQPKIESNETTKITVKSQKPVIYTDDQQADQSHRFELTLQQNNNTDFTCIVCLKPIIVGSPCWCCKECKCSVHRKCRSEVKTPCREFEAEIQHASSTKDTESLSSNDQLSIEENCDAAILTDVNEPATDLILKSNITSPPLEINCIFEIFEDVILIGCKTGLFSYHLNTKTLTNISGIDNVICITATNKLSKAILIGSNGEHLYQCDLRHLQSRSKASACLKPKLETTILNFPFSMNEKWHLVKISNETDDATDTAAIAVTSTRIVLMKYDLNLKRFKSIRALDSATMVSSILFTKHTAIVSADKFFEIDLSTYLAEEFVDMSDSTLFHTRSYTPMNVFRISSQEFLLCFIECGIFVDEYGCRSRPYDLNWEYTPTGFIYCEPLLYISHFQIIQTMRIHRSFRNEVASLESDNDEPSLLRSYINMCMPTLLNKAEKRNMYVLSIEKDTNLQNLYVIDGVKMLKDGTNISLETLSSQGTCLTLDSGSNLIS